MEQQEDTKVKVDADTYNRIQAMKEMSSATPMVKRFVREIARSANNKWKHGHRMSCLVSSFILREFVTSAALNMFYSDPKAGEKFINDFFEGAKKDALDDWQNKKG